MNKMTTNSKIIIKARNTYRKMDELLNGHNQRIFELSKVSSIISLAIKNPYLNLKFIINNLVDLKEYIKYQIAFDVLDELKLLFEADVNFMREYLTIHCSGLHYCAEFNSSRVCKYLLAIGLDRNNGAADIGDAGTPLHTACWNSYIDIVKLLCADRTKIDINKCDVNNQNVLHTVCGVTTLRTTSTLEVIRFLLTDTDIDKNAIDINGNSPFAIACQTETHQIVRYLYSVKDLYKINIDPLNIYILNYKRKYTFKFTNNTNKNKKS